MFDRFYLSSENGTRFDLTGGLAGVISNRGARTEARFLRSDVKRCYNEQPGYAGPAEESLRHLASRSSCPKVRQLGW